MRLVNLLYKGSEFLENDLGLALKERGFDPTLDEVVSAKDSFLVIANMSKNVENCVSP